jgi:cyclopropane-fatty-acyl-phospholipid synthase
MLFGRLLERLVLRGSIVVVDARNQRHTFGDNTAPQVTVRLRDPRLHWQLFLNPGLTLGEAYMEGDLSIDGGDIYRFLDIIGQNLQEKGFGWGNPLLPGFAGLVSRLSLPFRRLLQANGRRRARRHAAHHYELNEQLYDLFLDPDRTYSCGYFRTANDSLELAQQQKNCHLAAKLRLRPGLRVLDIGCGWGGLALFLAQACDLSVTGVNVATEQVAAACRRAEARGLAARARFVARDYRDIEGVYDRIVSVGFLEHVGVPHVDAFFAKVSRCLAEDGVAVIHFIGRADGPGQTNAWLRKYIFPGGYCPALSEVIPAIERQRVWVTDIECWRLHYAWTLRHWRERFRANWAQAEALTNEKFCRMWEYYLAVCEMAFRYTPLAVYQIQIAKRVDALPYTRDYIGEPAALMPLTGAVQPAGDHRTAVGADASRRSAADAIA